MKKILTTLGVTAWLALSASALA
ncbi:MAG: hypothetical protein RLY82_1524, partial [Pseudomonadota bacterium]